MLSNSTTKTQSVRQAYRPAVTPALRSRLRLLYVLVALIGANSLYLVCVSAIEVWTGQTIQNFFFQYMFLGHLILGLLLILPFFAFSIPHLRNTYRRKNRRAVMMGYVLFASSCALILTGLLLTRAGPLQLRDAVVRDAVYWIHALCPLVILWSYWLHRLAGPPIKWRLGVIYLLIAGTVCAWMILMHTSDPRAWNKIGSKDGVRYFEPSLARTSDGKFIPAKTLANDQYCLECHPDVHSGWSESAHRFSSFNNPAYLASVMETREVSFEKDGDTQRSRWCAGCHDPVPFFSGQFDDLDIDIKAIARSDGKDLPHNLGDGITCTVCHAITHVNSTRGNADYTIEEPLHYPFAFSENKALKWINHQLVKANPSFHKRSMLKPFHGTAEFCSTCHKVHLPEALNDYRFLRGQNHYDSFHLSGVSGHGARSFYYPDVASESCNDCHMPLQSSDDFAARKQEGMDGRFIHDHLFPGANTALPYWRKSDAVVEMHQEFLKDSLRVDLFGLRTGGEIDSPLIAPLRPEIPELQPGKKYLLEVVLRTLTLGHHFTQGTADSNEVWLELTVRNGQEIIGQSGTMDEDGRVDPWSHFVNAFVLDRDGNRIDRRNAQDIFVPLYNHQIPPGAAQTVHFAFAVPKNAAGRITIEAKLKYRKFDHAYMEITKEQLGRTIDSSLPITIIASDLLQLPIDNGDGVAAVEVAQTSELPTWQRWNDFGIGMLLKGKAQLRQAQDAFENVESFGRYDGPLNLARLMYKEGRLDEAVDAIRRANDCSDPGPPPWTISWLSGLVNREQGHLVAAEENFRAVLAPNREAIERKFDFGKDYEVINLLGQTLFDRARRVRSVERKAERDELLNQAAAQFSRTLELDSENVVAHFALQQVYNQLGDSEKSEFHKTMHLKFKVDDNARDNAVAAARQRYPAANHASKDVVIYDLQRDQNGSK